MYCKYRDSLFSVQYSYRGKKTSRCTGTQLYRCRPSRNPALVDIFYLTNIITVNYFWLCEVI